MKYLSESVCVCVCMWERERESVSVFCHRKVNFIVYVCICIVSIKTDAAGRYFCWDDFSGRFFDITWPETRNERDREKREKGIDSFRFSDFIISLSDRKKLYCNILRSGCKSWPSWRHFYACTRSWFVLSLRSTISYSIDLKARGSRIIEDLKCFE